MREEAEQHEVGQGYGRAVVRIPVQRPLTLARSLWVESSYRPSGLTVWLGLLGKRDRMPQHQLPGAADAAENDRGRSRDVLRGAVHRVVLVDPTGQ
jgi:hypothetical protein